MITRRILLTLVLLFVPIIVSAQDLLPEPKARLLDEFGALQISDIKARLDPAALEMQNDPASTMIIISYRGQGDPIGKTIRNLRMMRTYLIRSRGLDPSRLNMIDGGEIESGFKFQFWIVPAGAKAPELLKSNRNSLENTKIARKFDEYYYAFEDLEYDYWDGDTFKEFAALIKKEPDSIAYVILYPEYNKYGDENDKPVIRMDSLRKVNRITADIRIKLNRKNGIPLSKLKIVNGGYRDYRQVELWILPKGIQPPIATPNAFPKFKRKSGKR